MADLENIIAFLLTLVGVLITLLIPVPVKEEYRIFMVSIVISIFIILIISRFENKLRSNLDSVDDLNKRFKTLEELNDIRLDIRELRREVFKNG